ncbi:MAG: polysaccharide deacetylase family protein, partial [Chloroflexota bacterium]
IQWLKELGLPDENLINEVCSVLGVDWDAFLRDERPYLSHHQIKQMHADGFTIGAHTKTHRKLADLSDTEKESEIIDSCLQITEITGQEIVPFSFPHSAYGVERNFLSDLRKRKPLLGLLFDTKDLRLDEKFIVNRVWAERPIAPTGDLRPLDEILRAAYRNAWVDGVMNLGRRLRGSNIAVQ